MHSKVSSGGLRFFAHDRAGQNCSRAYESLAHHLLKLELATAVRAAGWRADLEISNVERSWRTDVLATSPDGTSKMAWEAQLSPITSDEATARTSAMARDGIPVCWVAMADRPWVGTVPSLLIREPETRSESWRIASGVLRHDGQSIQDLKLTLPWFVESALHGRLTHQALPRPLRLPGSQRTWHAVWASAADIENLNAHADKAVLGRYSHSLKRPIVAEPRLSQPPQLDPSAGPYVEPPDDIDDLLRQHVAKRFSGPTEIDIGERSPQWGNGRPVYVNGHLCGIAYPHPDEPAQWQNLHGCLIFVPYNQTHWFGRVAPYGTIMEIIRRDP